MTPLLDRLVYLDRDFISGAYEEQTGRAPTTQITKTEGMNAGAKIPFFSAGLSAGESRTFAVSTLGMLRELLPSLEEIQSLTCKAVGSKKKSTTGWITGELSIFKVEVNEQGKNHDQLSQKPMLPIHYHNPIVASETYFAIHGGGLKLALITTPDYFSSGLNALTKLYETVLEETTIPVTALVRVMASRSTFNEWIGVPLVILEAA
jgi:hypothetical protein